MQRSIDGEQGRIMKISIQMPDIRLGRTVGRKGKVLSVPTGKQRGHYPAILQGKKNQKVSRNQGAGDREVPVVPHEALEIQ